MHITLPLRYLHLARYGLLPALAGIALTQWLPTGHWYFLLLTALIATPAVVLVLGAFTHATQSEDCCPAEPTLPRRVLAAARRPAFTALVITCLTWIVYGTVAGEGSEDSPAIRALRCAMTVCFGLHIMARSAWNSIHHGRVYRLYFKEALAQRRDLIHQSVWLCIGAGIVSTVLNFLPQENPGLAVLNGLGSVVFLGLFILHIHHGRTLCEHCVGEMRVDAAEYAARRTKRFSAMHVGARFILYLISGQALAMLFVSGLLAKGLSAGCLAVTMTMVWLTAWHGRYQPWCPLCHPRGGDDGPADETVPDPTGGHGRPLPVA